MSESKTSSSGSQNAQLFKDLRRGTHVVLAGASSSNMLKGCDGDDNRDVLQQSTNDDRLNDSDKTKSQS